MSGRTFTRFTLAGLLAAALAAPAAAQPPAEAPPPALLRIDAAFPVELLPHAAAYQLGATAATLGDESPVALAAAAFAAGVPCCEEGAAASPCPTPAVTAAAVAQAVAGCTPPGRAVWRTVPLLNPDPDVCAAQLVRPAAPAACCAVPSAGLTGTYYRQMPGAVVGVAFTGGELKATLAGNEGGTVVTLTLTADYAVSKDGTVHGVVTGVDVDVAGLKDMAGADFADAALELQGLVDQPFAFRCRPTAGGLMVSNLRFGGKGDNGVQLGMLLGLYKPAGSDPVPCPKPAKAVPVETVGLTLPSPQYLSLNPRYVTPEPLQVVPPPACPSVRVAVAPCPVPGAVACPAPCLPPVAFIPPAPPVVSGAPVPVFNPTQPHVTPVGYAYPPPPMMPAPAMPMVAPAPAARGLAGTWYRDVGPVQCVFAFKNGQLTATATMNLDAGDKVGSYGMVVTADYYVTRDGSGLVGVVTGMDVVLDGACGTEPEMLKAVEDLGKAQKCLVGQPFCCTFRIHDDTLMVGDLRLAVAKDSPFGGDEVAMIAGRYKAAGPNGVPKAKPMKTKNAERAATVDVPLHEVVRAAEVLPVMPPPVQLGVPVGGGRYVQVPALGAAVGTAANPAVVQVQRFGVDFTDVPPTARPAVAPQWWWAENPTILLPGK